MARMPKAHRDYHPAKHTAAPRARSSRRRVEIPDVEQLELKLSGREVKLTNLKKLFWPELKITKRDLLQYYADVAPVLLPHLQDRAMVMKRYPNGAAGEFFFMKRAPSPRPAWIEIWTIAKEIAHVLAPANPQLITAVYKVAKRPKGRVLVDYNQNAWGRTLASIYSVRPTPRACVSTPVTWKEIEKGIKIEDFRIDNVRKRIDKLGDLWKPLLDKRKRFDLKPYLK